MSLGAQVSPFSEYPSFAPLFGKNLHTQGHEILSQKTRDVEVVHGEDFVILSCTVLIQIKNVTDGQTDGRA